MGMVVQHNMNAINAYNRLNANVAGLKKASEKLSSGYRINRAGDDAAGLAISEKMRSQIKGLNQATRNAQDGINMIQTFEGAAQETHTILQRMKELATESANGTYDDPTDRAAVQLEFDHLNDELNQIADTDFNGTIVLNGGVMADGLKAEGGEFNYANLKKQQAEELAKAPVDLVAQKDKNGKGPSLDDTNFVGGSTTVDTDPGAAKLWKQAKDDGYDASKSDHINIKYTISGVDDDGKVTGYTAEYVDDNGKKIAAVSTNPTLTANGGVQDTVTGANVVMDTIGAKAGDFVTVKYYKPVESPQAPTNIGFGERLDADNKTTLDSFKITDADGILSTNDVLTKPELKIEDNVKDTWLTDKDVQDAIAALDGATIDVIYTATAAKAQNVVPTSIALKDAAGNTIMTATAAADTAKTGWGLKAAAANATTITYKGKDIFTFTSNVTVNEGADATLAGKTATVSSKIHVDGYRAPSGAAANATLIADPSSPIDKHVSDANAFEQATSRMTYTEDITLQTGARTKDAVNFNFNYNADKSADMGKLKNNLDLSSRENGLNTANLSLANQKSANEAIDQIDKAINKTSMVRASFGAMQNRLEHKITNLTTTSENLTEAESSIRDTDMASEMMNYTKFNILQQAAQSMLAQANQQPQSVLQLLG